MQHNQKLLEVDNLYVSFNTYAGEVKAVRNINFHLYPGETLAFVGESGCGKTVTAKSLMRLLPAESSARRLTAAWGYTKGLWLS